MKPKTIANKENEGQNCMKRQTKVDQFTLFRNEVNVTNRTRVSVELHVQM